MTTYYLGIISQQTVVDLALETNAGIDLTENITLGKLPNPIFKAIAGTEDLELLSIAIATDATFAKKIIGNDLTDFFVLGRIIDAAPRTAISGIPQSEILVFGTETEAIAIEAIIGVESLGLVRSARLANLTPLLPLKAETVFELNKNGLVAEANFVRAIRGKFIADSLVSANIITAEGITKAIYATDRAVSFNYATVVEANLIENITATDTFESLTLGIIKDANYLTAIAGNIQAEILADGVVVAPDPVDVVVTAIDYCPQAKSELPQLPPDIVPVAIDYCPQAKSELPQLPPDIVPVAIDYCPQDPSSI